MEFHQETLLVYEPDTTEDRRQLVLREQSTNKQTRGHTKDQSRNMVIIERINQELSDTNTEEETRYKKNKRHELADFIVLSFHV